MGKKKRQSRIPYEYKEEEISYFNDGSYSLRVGESQIHLGGLGVYAEEYIPNHSIIGYYTGAIRNQGDPPYHPGFAFQLNHQYFIDGFVNPRNIMAMINDAHRTSFQYNCDFEVYIPEGDIELSQIHEKMVEVRTIQPIHSGEELFISYGDEYWEW